MKKLFILLTMLIVGIGSSWATDGSVTITSSSAAWSANGTFSNTSGNNAGSWRSTNGIISVLCLNGQAAILNYNTKSRLANGNSFLIVANGDNHITGFSIKFKAYNEDGTARDSYITFHDGVNVNSKSSAEVTKSFSGLNAQVIKFTTGNNWVDIIDFSVSYAEGSDNTLCSTTPINTYNSEAYAGWLKVQTPSDYIFYTMSSLRMNLRTNNYNTDVYLVVSDHQVGNGTTSGLSESDFTAISSNSSGTSSTDVTFNFTNPVTLRGGSIYYLYFATKSNNTYTLSVRGIKVQTGSNSLGVGGSIDATSIYSNSQTWSIPFTATLTPVTSNLKCRLKAKWPNTETSDQHYTNYVFAKTDNLNKLYKNNKTELSTADMINAKMVWNVTYSGSGLKLQNVGTERYISKFTSNKANGDAIDLLTANNSTNAETLKIQEYNTQGQGYIALVSGNQLSEYNRISFLESFSSTNDYVGCHNNYDAGDAFIFERVKTVTFSQPIAVNSGSAVSTIYVATDGSDILTLPSGNTYTINGQTYYSAIEAANVIKTAGTNDISVEVKDCTTGKYRLLQCWRDNGTNDYYLYANTNDGQGNANRLWKTANTSTLITNTNFVWKLQSSSSYLKIYNPSADRYISVAASASTQGSNTNALTSDNNADNAEPFNIIIAKKETVSGFNLKASTQTNMFLDSWTTGDNFVGWHTSATHYGAYFKLIPVKTVTFSSAIAVNGGDAVSTICVAQDGSDSFTLPGGYVYTFNGTTYTATSAATAIAAAGTDDITVTVNSVITDLSNISNSKKYKIICNRGGLSTYSTGSNTYLASPTKTELGISAKDFAILSYEDRYYLYSVNDKKFVTYQSEQIAPLADNITGTSDAISFQQISDGVYAIKFDNSTSKYLNCWSGYDYGIVINNYNEWDDGNQYVIEEAGNFDPTEAIAALISPKLLTLYNNLSSVTFGTATGEYSTTYESESGAAADITSVGTMINMKVYAAYPSLYTTLLDIQSKTTLNTEEGFYRIKTVDGSKYVKGLDADHVLPLNAGGNDDSSIFYLTRSNNLVHYKMGLYLYLTNNPCPVGSEAYKDTYEFLRGSASEQHYIHATTDPTGSGFDKFWFDNDTYLFRTESSTTATEFKLEPVEEIPVTFNKAARGYATFFTPVELKIPDGVKAYVCNLDGNNMTFYSVTNVEDHDGDKAIPANTAVMLYCEAVKKGGYENDVTVDFHVTLCDYVIDTNDNSFYGTLAAENYPDNKDVYSLRVNTTTNKVGFFKKSEKTTLAGFKAWLKTDKSTEARTITINFDGESDPTGIVEALGLDNENVDIYDLNGRKLSSYRKGINIVNGKKVMIQ